MTNVICDRIGSLMDNSIAIIVHKVYKYLLDILVECLGDIGMGMVGLYWSILFGKGVISVVLGIGDSRDDVGCLVCTCW